MDEPTVVVEMRQREHPWQKPEKYIVHMSDGSVIAYVPERTCKFVANIINTAWDDEDNEIETGEVDEESDMSCGNCGYPMVRGEYDGWWDEERGPYGGWFLKPRFNCCPECGSRVIDWDGRKKED